MRSYEQIELDRVQAEKQEFPIRIKIQSDSGETRWLNISLETFGKIERAITSAVEVEK